jgi:hypothetical protein
MKQRGDFIKDKDLEITGDSIISMNGDVLLAVFEDGGVVLSLKDRIPHAVNKTGAKILELLNEKGSVNMLVSNLAGTWQQPEDAVKDDIIQFLGNVLKRGWVNVEHREEYYT